MIKENHIEAVCWNCNKQFSTLVEIKNDENNQQKNTATYCTSEILSVDCPICGAECILDITSYLRKNSKIIYR